MPPSSRAQALTETVDVNGLDGAIQKQKNSISYKIRDLVTSTHDKLQTAEDIIDKTETFIDGVKVGKGIVSDLLAPVQEVVNLLDAISDIHPAIKVVAGIVKVIVKIEIARQENDKQVAVVFYTMSSVLFLLSDLDPVFADEDGIHERLKLHLETVCKTITNFGNFCEVYYKNTSSLVKTIRYAKYRDILTNYTNGFVDHKKELQLLLTSQSTMKLLDIQVDVKKIVAFLNIKTSKEQKDEDTLKALGGADRVMQDEKLLNQLATKLGEQMTPSIRNSLQTDLEKILDANGAVFKMRVDQLSHQIQESIDESTRLIVMKLDAGPHEFIDDPDIKLVWKEMGSRTSAKCRIFLDAIHQHYSNKFRVHEQETGNAHPDKWTLSFLSKIIFYPAIGDAIDEDSSGFVSVHEVNHFLKSRPSDLNWSVPQWLAFWAAGQYQLDVRHAKKHSKMVDTLKAISNEVLPENTKRVKYFCAIVKDLKLLDVYYDMFEYFGESYDTNSSYKELDKICDAWDEREVKRIKENLERAKYRLASVDNVLVVTGGSRLEYSLLCLADLLLRRHTKIVKLASKQVISSAEFIDMRDTWNNLFDAIDSRLNNLIESWRQQRLDPDKQVIYYAGGIFEDWHQKREASSDSGSDSDSDDEDSEDDEGSEEEDVNEKAGSNIDDNEDHAEKKDKEPVDLAKALLLYPIPADPENDKGLTTDEESDWETAEEKKKKADAALLERVQSIETKLSMLTDLEALLKKLLVAQGLTVEEAHQKGNDEEDGMDSRAEQDHEQLEDQTSAHGEDATSEEENDDDDDDDKDSEGSEA